MTKPRLLQRAVSIVRNLPRAGLLAPLLVLALAAPPVQAETQPPHVMFILDASNSMWGQIDGVAKIEIAKDILASTAAGLPAGTKSGLIAYGNRFSHELNDCDDMELVGGYYANDQKSYAEMLAYVTPKGQTPIANTLRESIDWVADDGARNPTVVLITDGIESCDGDPCAAAKALADSGISTTIHVVGFDLTNDQRDAMRCIAENGHGMYFAANDAAGLTVAMEQVTIEIEQVDVPAPKPVPSRNLAFVDEFERENLGESWVARNPDTEGYVLDGGEMLIANAGVGGFREDEAANIMTLQQALPDGDWDINYKLKADLKTGRDSVWFGLRKDAGNSMSGHLWTAIGCCDCSSLMLTLVKRASGEETVFTTAVRGNGGCGGMTETNLRAFLEDISGEDVVLTLSKRGREYSAAMQILGEQGEDGAQKVYRTDALASLRPPGAPSFAASKYEETQGEVLVYLDRFEIETIN